MKDATYKVADQGTPDLIAQDYTGEIEKETWTTLTITRELCMRNYDAYKNKGYSIAIALSAKDDTFRAREVIYIDNVQLLVAESTMSDAAKTFMADVLSFAPVAVRISPSMNRDNLIHH